MSSASEHLSYMYMYLLCFNTFFHGRFFSGFAGILKCMSNKYKVIPTQQAHVA